MDKTKRRVELIFCQTHGSDSGQWYTDEVEVPIALPWAKIKELALHLGWKLANKRTETIIHIAIYCIWSDEMMEMLWDEEE